MIHFQKIRYKNLLSTGNQFTEIQLDRSSSTLLIGPNGAGKCFHINTPIQIRNKKSGELVTTTIGEFYSQMNHKNA